MCCVVASVGKHPILIVPLRVFYSSPLYILLYLIENNQTQLSCRMAEQKPRSFNCLNCQRSMQFDPTCRNLENDRKRTGDMEEGLGGQSVNLIKVICDAEVPAHAPICRECSDELMKYMDEQLASRDKECLAYKKLLEDLRRNFSLTRIDSQKEKLRILREEEQTYIRELAKLEEEERRLEEEQQQLKMAQNKESDEEKKYWRDFRDKHRRLLELTEVTARVDAELRYAERQHNRLASTNVLDLAFHIWVDSEGGTIPEINGHRLGRLPDKPVDWLEINAAFGQIVLLMDVLMQRANVKQSTFELVAQGSHSCVKTKKPNGDLIALPLHSSGSWKPFGNNNMDSGITALLGCFELLYNTLQTQDPNFRLQYKINKDRLIYQNVEYSAKMLLNSEERWTKAMKMFLANLKTAQVQVVAMRVTG